MSYQLGPTSDWHTLLEFCGLVGCLLADEEAIYDPRLPDDRLLRPAISPMGTGLPSSAGWQHWPSGAAVACRTAFPGRRAVGRRAGSLDLHLTVGAPRPRRGVHRG